MAPAPDRSIESVRGSGGKRHATTADLDATLCGRALPAGPLQWGGPVDCLACRRLARAGVSPWEPGDYS